MDRRIFIRTSGMGAAGAVASLTGCATTQPGAPAYDAAESRMAAAQSDDAFWAAARELYTPPRDYVDLDHANTAPVASPVFDAFVRRSRTLSTAPAEEFGRMWGAELEEKCRGPLAAYLGTARTNLAFVQNTTAALNTVIHGFTLSEGDEILVTNHEYPDMVEAVLQRVQRDRLTLRKVEVPLPNESPMELVARVVAAITPRTRLLLISHISAWNGEILPVAEVTRAARQRGVAVLLDAAQSVGLIDVNFDEIGCDFMGASLHKGLGAPMPTGVLLMRPERLKDVWPLHPPSWSTEEYPMDKYEWSGTFNMAALATTADALAFQQKIGLSRKVKRLRGLSAHWQDGLRNVPGVRLLTPRDAARWCGPAAFAVDGIPSADLAKQLRTSHGVLVQSKAGRHSPFENAVRVSPGAHATFQEIDKFIRGVRAIAGR